MMRAIVRTAKRNPANRDLAAQIVAFVPSKDFRGECAAVLEFVRREIRYTLDPNGHELLQTPRQTLRLGYGDCDDFCILVSCLCECLGSDTRFLAMGFDRAETYSHVIVQARPGAEGSWLSIDATESYPLGWTPPHATHTMGCEVGEP